MSVYRHKGSPYWHYDFQVGGHRFHGSTGATAKGAALAVEATERAKAKVDAKHRSERARGAPPTFDEAAGQWWLEVGQFCRNHKDIDRYLAWLTAEMGSLLLTDISTARVSALVAKRRGHRYGSAKRLVSNATVNRSVTELLRRILRRAAVVWEEQGLRAINWGELLLREPPERIREASDGEEGSILDALRDDARPIVAFLLLSGCRMSEAINLTWDKVDWDGRVVVVTGKGDKDRPIPITSEIRKVLWPLRGHHPRAVFTYEARRPVPRKRIAVGDRVPMTVNGFKKLWRNGRGKSGVTDFRLHDSRHTAATRLLRGTGNLKLVQKLLGHADITTTAKYAHAMVDDLRDGMEAVQAKPSRNLKKAG